MFQILYRCLYRDHWYDDVDPVDSFEQAVATAQYLRQLRGTPVIVMYNGQVVYSA